MTCQIVKLSFSAPVHFGEGRLTDSAYTCDAATLFSALYIEALKMGCAAELLQAAHQGDIAFSDALPYINDTLYVPLPLAKALAENINAESTFEQKLYAAQEQKARKQLQYIPLHVLSSYPEASLSFVEQLNKFNLGVPNLRTKVNLTRQTSQDAKPYHVGSFTFNPNCGIYFIVNGMFDIAPLFEQLGYSGIGGKRSSGYGRFQAQFESAAMFEGAVTSNFKNKGMLLCSALPSPEELTDNLLDGAHYSLKRKSGFVQSVTHASPFQKKRDMWLFAPGSVFRQPFTGSVFDVNTTAGAHPVYRYARALWMEV